MTVVQPSLNSCCIVSNGNKRTPGSVVITDPAKSVTAIIAMNRKVSTLLENIAESGSACLITMVQGNVLAIGISHWIVASQTGLFAGAASVGALALAKTDNRWAVAGILGGVTAIVDYFVHPGMIGGAATEAIITGAGAAALSLIVHQLVSRARRRRRVSAK